MVRSDYCWHVRPLRVEYPGAYYHVMNRVAGRKLLFRRGDVLALFVHTLEEALAGFGVRCHAWCLMGNHYHLLLETPHGDLSRALRHLNSVFSSASIASGAGTVRCSAGATGGSSLSATRICCACHATSTAIPWRLV